MKIRRELSEQRDARLGELTQVAASEFGGGPHLTEREYQVRQLIHSDAGSDVAERFKIGNHLVLRETERQKLFGSVLQTLQLERCLFSEIDKVPYESVSLLGAPQHGRE